MKYKEIIKKLTISPDVVFQPPDLLKIYDGKRVQFIKIINVRGWEEKPTIRFSEDLIEFSAVCPFCSKKNILSLKMEIPDGFELIDKRARKIALKCIERDTCEHLYHSETPDLFIRMNDDCSIERFFKSDREPLFIFLN